MNIQMQGMSHCETDRLISAAPVSVVNTPCLTVPKGEWLHFQDYRKFGSASRAGDVGYADQEQTQWGVAGAGLLILSPDRKQVALFMRSEHVTDPSLLGIPGGARGKLMDGTLESSLITSVTEAKEELRCIPQGRLWNIPAQYTNPENNYTYDTFVVTLYAKEHFEPKLNWEHSSFVWKDIGDAKTDKKLHPGVKFALDKLRPSSNGGTSSIEQDASPWAEQDKPTSPVSPPLCRRPKLLLTEFIGKKR